MATIAPMATAPNPNTIRPDADPMLSETDAARLLGVAAITLRTWRSKDKAHEGTLDHMRKAPPHTFTAAGHPRYRMSELRHWLATLPKEGGMPVFPDNRRKLHRELARDAA